MKKKLGKSGEKLVKNWGKVEKNGEEVEEKLGENWGKVKQKPGKIEEK